MEWVDVRNFAVALFIGALIIWMLLKPMQSRPIVHGLGALRVVLASYWPALLIVVCQVLVMYVVVHFGVGLQARYPLATVAFLFLIGATFLAVIQAFNALFGVSVGRVVTLAFLMLQLVSAGGIYPVETTARPAPNSSTPSEKSPRAPAAPSSPAPRMTPGSKAARLSASTPWPEESIGKPSRPTTTTASTPGRRCRASTTSRMPGIRRPS